MNDNTKLDHDLKLKLLEAFIFASPEPVKFSLLRQFEDNFQNCVSHAFCFPSLFIFQRFFFFCAMQIYMANFIY